MTDLVEFRSVGVHNLDGIFLEVTRGFLMPAKVRGTDYVVAAKAGRTAGNRVADVLEIMLEGYVVADDPETWYANRTTLLGILDESGQDPGILVVRAPLYGLATGASASINARVVNAVEGPINSYQRQTWSIALESIDPAWVLAP